MNYPTEMILPVDPSTVREICKEVVGRLISLDVVMLDRRGYPFWCNSGDYLDGIQRFGECGDYYPDGVPGASK